MLTGQCLCGGVRFTLSEPPAFATYCHCTRCQRRTGTAASAQARVDAAALAIQGAARLRAWRHPEGGWEKLFCGRCGSHLFSRDPADLRRMGVRLGAFDGDPGLRPSARAHVASAAAWEPIPDDGLPRHAGGLPGSR